MTKLASPALVTEKLPGMLPAAMVSSPVSAGAFVTVGRVGCWGRQAISPGGGGERGSPAHVHPSCASTHTTDSKSGIKARKARRKAPFMRPPQEDVYARAGRLSHTAVWDRTFLVPRTSSTNDAPTFAARSLGFRGVTGLSPPAGPASARDRAERRLCRGARRRLLRALPPLRAQPGRVLRERLVERGARLRARRELSLPVLLQRPARRLVHHVIPGQDLGRPLRPYQ